MQSRRQLRGWVTGLAGSVILAQVVLDQWLEAALVGKLVFANAALLLVALLLLAARSGVLFGTLAGKPDPDIRSEPQPTFTPPDTSALQQAITDGLYRQEGLTLSAFARTIRMPDYKVRQLINEQMGFRNFPDFINHYRLVDACQRLKENPEEPITVIALDMGFRSVSSFNRVFKEHLKTTPSQYRRSV